MKQRICCTVVETRVVIVGFRNFFFLSGRAVISDGYLRSDMLKRNHSVKHLILEFRS